MPEPDGVTLDYRGYDGVPVRTHFRFTSTGKIGLTACAPKSGRLKCLGRRCRRPNTFGLGPTARAADAHGAPHADSLRFRTASNVDDKGICG